MNPLQIPQFQRRKDQVILFLLPVLFFGARPATGKNDPELLHRMGGAYRGKQTMVTQIDGAAASIRNRLNVRLTLPRRKGKLKGALLLDSGGFRTRIKGRIKRVKCRGNRVVYQGKSQFSAAGNVFRSRNFKSIASTRGMRGERVRATATYVAFAAGGNVLRATGTFRGRK